MGGPDRREERGIVGRCGGVAARGPARTMLALLAGALSLACVAAPGTVQVPMLLSTDEAFDAGAVHPGDRGDGGDGRDGGAVELEPAPPADALACRRDVACRASALPPQSPGSPGSPSSSSSPAPSRRTPSPAAARASSALPSPFEQCALQDDRGRHFSAKETRDARLTDAARCCYVAFVDCVRGARR